MSTRRTLVALVFLGLLSAAFVFACGGDGFDPQSKVDSVRMFGVRVDKPYARPGDTVNMEVLLADGRSTKPRPLRLYWIPLVCLNPPNDLYYLCFAGAAGGGDGGAATGPRFIPTGPLADAAADAGAGAAPGGGGGGGPLQQIPAGVDLSPFLPQGSTFSFRMPEDAVIPRPGTDPYGLAVVFNIACAGQVRLAEPDPGGGLQQVPIQCTDENGVQLPPSDYVIGISRVFAYTERTNENPIIERLTFEGEDVHRVEGITVDRCTAAKRIDCPEKKIDIRVSDSSWEENPSDVVDGRVLREQIWASFYTNKGDIDVDARLLFDTTKGRPDETAVSFRPSSTPGRGMLWVVVHDNRGGKAWVVVPVVVR